MPDCYPRVLLVCAPSLNFNSATGTTMVNLFKGWPIDKIAQIYDDFVEPDSASCSNYWRYSSEEVPLVNALKRMKKSLLPKRGHGAKFEKVQLIQKDVNNSLKHSTTTVWGDLVPIRLSDDLTKWIDEFRPEVIYTILGSIRMMRVVQEISASHSIKVVPHFMDDWPETIYKGSFLQAIPRKFLLLNLKSVLKKSYKGMTISEDMAREYKVRYGLSFEAFMNCVEIESEFLPKKTNVNGLFSFGYVGGLHLNRWKSLLDIGEAIEGFNRPVKVAELVIHAPSADIDRYREILSELPCVRIGNSLASGEISSSLKKYDVLVHIESFDKQDYLYTRLSISTKIPLYMSSGLPILAYGPLSVSSMKYIESTGSGLVADGKQKKTVLLRNIQELMASGKLRTEIGEKGYKNALLYHDAVLERDKFKKMLSTCSGKP